MTLQHASQQVAALRHRSRRPPTVTGRTLVRRAPISACSQLASRPLPQALSPGFANAVVRLWQLFSVVLYASPPLAYRSSYRPRAPCTAALLCPPQLLPGAQLPELSSARHFLNLTNGIEAIPTLEGLGLPYRWVRRAGCALQGRMLLARRGGQGCMQHLNGLRSC